VVDVAEVHKIQKQEGVHDAKSTGTIGHRGASILYLKGRAPTEASRTSYSS
jgi:hypothetical protein